MIKIITFSEPIVGRVHPKSLVATLGETVRFVCISDDDDEVQWKHEDGALPHNVIQSHVEDSLEHAITILSVKITNTGFYKCVGEDNQLDIGFYERAYLSVKGLLNI